MCLCVLVGFERTSLPFSLSALGLPGPFAVLPSDAPDAVPSLVASGPEYRRTVIGRPISSVLVRVFTALAACFTTENQWIKRGV